jgi:F-type H+-transporting ATPase subunit c
MSMGLALFGAGIGAGLVLIGASYGIGRLAAAAMEGTARQPEAGGIIRISMLIAAALIEGIAFFALVVCFLVLLWAQTISRGAPEAAPAAPTAVNK